tara:strand:+ start:349 stop:1656 length:1308 start_codon:yes stop_codon:yes gene_type:complete
MTGLSPGCNCCGPCGPNYSGSGYYRNIQIYCYGTYNQSSFSNEITDWLETWYKTREEILQRWIQSEGFGVYGSTWTQMIHEGDYEFHSNINGITGRIYHQTISYDYDDPDSGQPFLARWQPSSSNYPWNAFRQWRMLSTSRRRRTNNSGYTKATYGIFLQHACKDDVAVGVKVVSGVGKGDFSKTSGAELKNALGYGPMPGAWVHKDNDQWYEESSLQYGFGVDIQHASIDDGDSCKLRYCYYISNSDNPDDNGVLVEGESDVALEGEIELRWEVSKEKRRIFTRKADGTIDGPGEDWGRATNCWGIRDVQLIIKFEGEVVHESQIVEKWFNDLDMKILSESYKLSLNPLGLTVKGFLAWDGYYDCWLDPNHRAITADLPSNAAKNHPDRHINTPVTYNDYREGDTNLGWGERTVQRYDERDWYFGKPEVYTEIL